MGLNHDAARAGFGLFAVDAAHGDRAILRRVDLPLYSGEFHILIGGRNSGKSAIAATIMGELPVLSGTVRLAGSGYTEVSPELAREKGVSTVGATPQVFPDLTVAESLVYGEQSWLRSLRPWRTFLHEIRQWLDRIGIDIPLHCTLSQLPREEWVFVEILARLYQRPRVLILDEALEKLSRERLHTLMPILREHVDNGMAILWITHRIEDAMVMANRVSVIREGRILFSSRAEGLDHLNLVQLCYAQVDERDSFGRTMQQFRQLMRFTGALVRDLPQAVVILDAEMVVRFLNRRAESLFPMGTDGLGHGVDALFGDGNIDIAKAIAAAMANDQDGIWHNIPFRHDGGKTLSDITLRRIREGGQGVGYMLQVEDVSAREVYRRRLILSENLASVGLLAAGVAHEVNNPLEIVGNYLVFLKKKETDEETRRVLGKIEDEAARIQQIVNNLVVFSGESGAGETTVDLRALSIDLCDLLRFHNRARRIAFSCPPIDFSASIRADPTEMRQVLLNLFKNSIAVIRDGGTIRIDFERERGENGDRLTMRFRDDGPGLGLDNPDDVFLPFITTRAEGGKNHGLGLFIVYGIVEKYGGAIHVENAPEGGCVFTLSFPLE